MIITDLNKLKMGEKDKKKSKNKQNYEPIRKSTIQYINYTEQEHLPSANTIDLKYITKSIQLKKSLPLKKPLSRKSRCISKKQTCVSVKQTPTQHLGQIKYKQFLKKFQELKNIQQKANRSKSKSSKSILQMTNKTRSSVSNSKRKSSSKKFNLTALMNKNFNTQNIQKLEGHHKTQFNSRTSLTHKLDRTLKKIHEKQYFDKDQEDSLIPFMSTSQVCNGQNQKNQITYQISNNQFVDDQINIFEMRKFCKTLQSQQYENVMRKNINYFRGNQFEMMTIKIQRAWRRYRTKKLVQRYADVVYPNYIQSLKEEEQSSSQQIMNQDSENQDEQNFIKFNQERVISSKKYHRSPKRKFNDDQNYSDQQYSQQNTSPKSHDIEDVMIKTQQLYPQSVVNEQHMVTYISNLDSSEEQCQQTEMNKAGQSIINIIQKDEKKMILKTENEGSEIQNTEYEKIINQIKINQLQKWKEIIHILQQSKNNKNPLELESLLNKLAEQSEKNKKQLQVLHTNQIKVTSRNSNNKNIQTESDQFILRKRQASGPSDNSDLKKEQLEFDSKKYIQYLDSDMFIFQRDKSSQNSEFLIHDQRLGKKISARKQKHLLAVLNTDDAPIRLRTHTISKSQNLSYLFDDHNNNSFPINPRLSKCISEKNIQKAMRSISPQIFYKQEHQQEDQLNLDLIRQQFLQNTDPIEQLEKLHSNNQLKKKIKQSREVIDQQPKLSQIDQEQDQHPLRISLDISKNFGSANNKQIQTDKQHQISQSYQIKVENVDKTIQQDENSEDDQKLYKADNVFNLIFNYLIFQVLKDMASYDSILEKFKQYTQSVKNSKKQIKKGFSTTHHEIKLFVDGLVGFLNSQQPQIFKNLQVPAGPTALEMLNYLHPNQDEEVASQESQDQTSVMVIPNRMFEQYWHVRQKNQTNQADMQNIINNSRKKQTHDFIKGLNKIFCRSIFDSFGECLDFQRNYGQAGKPYPWKKSANFFHKKTQQQIQKSIQNAKKRMHEIATTYCGLIIQKSDMAKISMQGSDDYINHVQQDRMSRMLAQDLIQNEQRWVFYDDQELQLLVQVSNIMVLILVVEACDEISKIYQK